MSNGKVVLITGASRGIGREMALAFGHAGHTVLVNFLKEKEKAAAVKKEIEARGGTAMLYPADISDRGEVAGLVAGAVKEFGRIDVLVHSAAINRDRSILKMSADEWDGVIRTDLSGAFYVLQACAGVMIKRKEGSIVTIASLAGLRGAYGAANYAAAKAGVIGLTRSAARELGRFNVRINAVLPGFHLTDMGKSLPDSYVQRAREESVLGCTTDIRELAQFVVMLTALRTVSGQVLNIDSRII
jgi:3-oxoacyl-[acyl-carrier protein] reductase